VLDHDDADAVEGFEVRSEFSVIADPPLAS
jgi:hypothetical protein